MPTSPEDIGGLGGAKESRKRVADIDFIQRCRSASEEELLKMFFAHCRKGAPEWKRVAIKRALARIARE